MRKDVLVNLIIAIGDDKDNSLSHADNEKINWLVKFIDESDAIRSLPDNGDVSLSEFYSYLSKNAPPEFQQSAFEGEFLTSSSKAAELFNKMKNKLSDNIGELGAITDDIRLNELAKHLDSKSIRALSQTSSSLFKETKKHEYWRDKLIKLGLKPDLVSALIKSQLITDYKNVYHAYQHLMSTRLDYDEEKTLKTELWMLACLSGEPAALSSLVNKGIATINQVNDENGMNPLHCAALSGSLSAMNTAMELGADALSRDNRGRSMLHYAALSGNAVAIELAIAIAPYPGSQDYNNLNMLHYAALSGSVSAMEKAIELGADPKSVDNRGLNVLHYAALSGNTSAMELAVKLGADPTVKDTEDQNMLHYAALSGSVPAMKKAVELGADPNNVNEDGYSILHLAVKLGNISAMKAGRELGADPNSLSQQGDSILHLAARAGNVAAMKEARAQGVDPNLLNESGQSMLHFAAMSGSVPAIKEALAQGADPKCVNTEGNTLLHYAAVGGKESTLFVRRFCHENNITLPTNNHAGESASSFAFTDEAKDALQIPVEKISLLKNEEKKEEKEEASVQHQPKV